MNQAMPAPKKMKEKDTELGKIPLRVGKEENNIDFHTVRPWTDL